MKNKAH